MANLENPVAIDVDLSDVYYGIQLAFPTRPNTTLTAIDPRFMYDNQADGMLCNCMSYIHCP